MNHAYIIDAVRSPTGRRGGALAKVHPADLGASVLSALLERSEIPPELVDDVIFGCVDALGPQAGDIARTSWLAAGLPECVPGTTIDRQCGSSQQAVHFAAQAIMSGTQEMVVAGGVQHMSAIPIGMANTIAHHLGFPNPFSGSRGWEARYGREEISQFKSADMIADKWGISRLTMEEFALRSHESATRAQRNGYFDREIVPVAKLAADESIRYDTSLEQMSKLPPLQPGGHITAAVSSQVCDGAAALLLASEGCIDRYELKPRARIHHMSVRGDNPVWMLTAPIVATKYALEKSQLSVEDIDLFECNEAFAPVVLAWQQELGIPADKINVNGGAIALGHPLGATGARIMTTLLHELERRELRFGLQTMCEGGGQANVTIIERLE